MAVYSMTITNSFNVFGEGASSKWNQYAWNAFKWGDGTTDIRSDVFHGVSAGSITLDSLPYAIYISKFLENSLTSTSSIAHLYLVDGSGYYHDFPGSATDARNRVESSWSDGSSTTPTWSSGTASSTSWS